MKRKFPNRAAARPIPTVDLPLLVTKMAEEHVNSPLTPALKTLLMNRFNQLLKTPDHPPYSAMIERAIVELKEKGGSSEESISKFLEKEYKDLPEAHLTFLKHHLAKLCESGVITLTRGKKYALAGANLSLKATAKSKESPVQRIFKWDLEKQQRRLKKQLVQKRNLSLKATVRINRPPVKRIFKWDWERQQRRLKKQLAQKRNKVKNVKVEVTEKCLEPNVVEKQSVEEQDEDRGHGLVSKTLRRSKRLQNDMKQKIEEEEKPDVSIEPVPIKELSERKCIQMPPRRSKRFAETRAGIKLSSELKRPEDQKVELGSENQISENRKDDMVINKFDGLKTYGWRRKAEFQEHLIVEDVKKEVQNLEQVKDGSTWISGRRLRPCQQKSDSKVVEELDEQAADVSCSALVVRTDEALETIDSVSNGSEKLLEERPKIKRLGRPPKRRRIGRPPKDQMEIGIVN